MTGTVPRQAPLEVPAVRTAVAHVVNIANDRGHQHYEYWYNYNDIQRHFVGYKKSSLQPIWSERPLFNMLYRFPSHFVWFLLGKIFLLLLVSVKAKRPSFPLIHGSVWFSPVDMERDPRRSNNHTLVCFLSHGWDMLHSAREARHARNISREREWQSVINQE